MTHLFRFFTEQSEDLGHVYLQGDESQHLKVVRLQIGDKLEVCNGQGMVYACVLKNMGKVAKCEVIARRYIAAPKTKVIAALAIQQSNMFGEVLRSLTELGIDTFVLFRHNHDAAFKLQQQRRWRKVVVNACKQAKRAWLPEVKLLQSWQEVMNYVRDYECLILDKSGECSLHSIKQSQDMCFIVGASCGFSAEELASLRALPRVKTISLGDNTLRAATAALYVGGYLSLLRDGR